MDLGILIGFLTIPWFLLQRTYLYLLRVSLNSWHQFINASGRILVTTVARNNGGRTDQKGFRSLLRGTRSRLINLKELTGGAFKRTTDRNRGPSGWSGRGWKYIKVGWGFERKITNDNHRKSGMPAAVLMPAPVWTTTCRAACTQSASRPHFSRNASTLSYL